MQITFSAGLTNHSSLSLFVKTELQMGLKNLWEIKTFCIFKATWLLEERFFDCKWLCFISFLAAFSGVMNFVASVYSLAERIH